LFGLESIEGFTRKTLRKHLVDTFQANHNKRIGVSNLTLDQMKSKIPHFNFKQYCQKHLQDCAWVDEGIVLSFAMAFPNINLIVFQKNGHLSGLFPSLFVCLFVCLPIETN
jgi:hypothetical protein